VVLVGRRLEAEVSPRPSRRRHPGGYTLVEVLIAMVILGLVLPGLATMLVSSRKAITSNYRMDQAYSYGQLVMDSATVIPSSRVASSSSTTVIAGTTYTAVLTPSTNADGSARLKLVVSWLQAGKSHSVELNEVLRTQGLYR